MLYKTYFIEILRKKCYIEHALKEREFVRTIDNEVSGRSVVIYGTEDKDKHGTADC